MRGGARRGPGRGGGADWAQPAEAAYTVEYQHGVKLMTLEYEAAHAAGGNCELRHFHNYTCALALSYSNNMRIQAHNPWGNTVDPGHPAYCEGPGRVKRQGITVDTVFGPFCVLEAWAGTLHDHSGQWVAGTHSMQNGHPVQFDIDIYAVPAYAVNADAAHRPLDSVLHRMEMGESTSATIPNPDGMVVSHVCINAREWGPGAFSEYRAERRLAQFGIHTGCYHNPFDGARGAMGGNADFFAWNYEAPVTAAPSPSYNSTESDHRIIRPNCSLLDYQSKYECSIPMRLALHTGVDITAADDDAIRHGHPATKYCKPGQLTYIDRHPGRMFPQYDARIVQEGDVTYPNGHISACVQKGATLTVGVTFTVPGAQGIYDGPAAFDVQVYKVNASQAFRGWEAHRDTGPGSYSYVRDGVKHFVGTNTHLDSAYLSHTLPFRGQDRAGLPDHGADPVSHVCIVPVSDTRAGLLRAAERLGQFGLELGCAFNRFDGGAGSLGPVWLHWMYAAPQAPAGHGMMRNSDVPANGTDATASDVVSGQSVPAERQSVPEPPATDAALIQGVRELASQTHHGDAHVDRWNRALAGLGLHNHTDPMTSTEATTNAGIYSSPLWPQIATALAALEEYHNSIRDVPQDPPQDTPQDPPQDTPQDVPQDPPQDTPQDQPQDTPQDPPADPPYTVPQALIQGVRELAGQAHHGHDHVDRWNRVLAGFGLHDHTDPMTAAEAQANTRTYSSPLWQQVADALTKLEGQ